MRAFTSPTCTTSRAGNPTVLVPVTLHHQLVRSVDRVERKGPATLCRYQDSRQESSPTPLSDVAESVERLVVTPVIRAAPWDPQRLQQQDQTPEACILLISESDVCRSVLAAACLRQALREAGLGGLVQVDTCGTRPYNLGEGPEPAAAFAAEVLGVALPPRHAARLFEPSSDIVSYDLLLTMDKFTAGDVMREVSSFDLVNKSSPFAYKVRRLGEFLDSPATRGSAQVGSEPAHGSEGDELDIEDPLYGNVGGEEEERAVLRAARTIRNACRGLTEFLRSVQDEAAREDGYAGGPHEDGSGGSHGADEEAACELPLPGQGPACSSSSVSEPAWGSEDQEAGAGRGRGRPSLGPALRARVQAMGPTPWLAPPMLSPRGKAPDY